MIRMQNTANKKNNKSNMNLMDGKFNVIRSYCRKRLPWTLILICRQGLQACAAEQHRITLSFTSVTSTKSFGSASTANGEAVERRGFPL